MAASEPTEVPGGVPEDAVDELYSLPIDDFTPRRDALARDLRAAGRRDAAAWVKGLRKPTAAAWIANQLTRTRAREARELLRAGDALRTAHERLVAGDGDRDDLRSASEEEQAAAQALAADAGGFLDRAGHAPSAATLDKVAQTIRAVALDDEARAGFERGRLTRERTASGFGPRETKPQVGARKARDAKVKQSAATRKAREALKKARGEQRLRARALKTAEREAERAGRRLERAQAGADEARSRMADLEPRIAAAERELGFE